MRGSQVEQDILRQDATVLRYTSCVIRTKRAQQSTQFPGITRDVLAPLQIAEGYPVKREDVAALSPYLTRHVKRFGDYFIDVSVPPQPLAESELALPLSREHSAGRRLCPILTRISAVPDEGLAGHEPAL